MPLIIGKFSNSSLVNVLIKIKTVKYTIAASKIARTVNKEESPNKTVINAVQPQRIAAMSGL